LQEINRGSRSIVSIATSNNIGQSTLSRWVKHYIQGNILGSQALKSNAALENSPLVLRKGFST